MRPFDELMVATASTGSMSATATPPAHLLLETVLFGD